MSAHNRLLRSHIFIISSSLLSAGAVPIQKSVNETVVRKSSPPNHSHSHTFTLYVLKILCYVPFREPSPQQVSLFSCPLIWHPLYVASPRWHSDFAFNHLDVEVIGCTLLRGLFGRPLASWSIFSKLLNLGIIPSPFLTTAASHSQRALVVNNLITGATGERGSRLTCFRGRRVTHGTSLPHPSFI